MKQYSLEISLLSDLCVSDGGVYNSQLDIDVCHDAYGLPYIPGKRIKGCLRECALELKDWGEDIQIEEIFGKGGDKNNSSAIRISDARLENDMTLVGEIISGEPVLYHPQNVLGQYTYIRTQTSIDPETGVAKKNSLRTMRVINRGLRFISEVEAVDSVSEKQLTKICACLRNMGLSRTRGLGEVECSLKPIPNTSDTENSIKNDPDKVVYHGENLLRYDIELLEPMICKSINGGESDSIDYIEGAKIIGLLAERLDDGKKLREYLDNGVKFSNAYITSNGVRAAAAGAYLYRIKNNDRNYINKLYFQEADDEHRQFSVIRGSYAIMSEDGSMKIVPVNMEERYHHSRPSDKSIGRATDSGGSKFYQISSISRGQVFSGFISGTPEQLTDIIKVLGNVESCYLGYGRGSEYGKCRFRTKGCSTPNQPQTSGKVKQIAVTLNAPAIVYNNRAMYSIDKKDLLEEVLASLGLAKDTVVKADFFINFTSVGGYNVTWGTRKPVIRAFDKGTAVKLKFKEEQEIHIEDYMCLGERTAEGYGEFVCELLSEGQTEKDWKYLDANAEKPDMKDEGDERSKETVGALGRGIYDTLLDNYIREKASEIVRKQGLNKDGYKATISNLLLICDEQEKIEKVEAAVKERFSKNSANKRDKADKATKIIKAAKENYQGITEKFSAMMNISYVNRSDDVKLLMKLLKYILIEAKYQIRKASFRNDKEGGKDDE